MRHLLLLLILFISSCNVMPDYNRPEIALPENWRFDPENNIEYANLPWWEQFGDPVLNDLIRMALENNQNLQVATQTVLNFFYQYRVSASQLFPQIYLNTGAERVENSQTIALTPPSPGIPRIGTIYQLVANFLSYEVDFWGQIRSSIASSKASYEAQIYSRDTVIITLVSSVALTYVQLRQYDKQLEISKETYKSRKEEWDINIARFNAGLVSQMEVKQAESQAEDAEVQIENFQSLIGQTEDALSVLLGVPPGPIPRGVLLSELTLPPSIPAGVPCNLIDNRPDILQAEQNMISANAQIGVQRANFFPQLNLSGIDGLESTSLNKLLTEGSETFNMLALVSQPLVTGGKLTGLLNQAEAQYQETVHTYLQTILTALQEVEDALIQHETDKQKLVIQEKEIAALDEYYKLAKMRYDNGLNDYLTVLDAETSLFNVQLAEVNTQADLFVSLINLYKALGQGWDPGGDYCIN